MLPLCSMNENQVGAKHLVMIITNELFCIKYVYHRQGKKSNFLMHRRNIWARAFPVMRFQEFPRKCHLVRRHRARLLHNEQFAPFYGNVLFNKAPHLHACPCRAEIPKCRLLRCSLLRSLFLCLFWCLFRVTGGRSVPLPRLWLGEPLAPFRRNGEQGGGAFPRSQPGLK